jgi:hypothetical protein
VPTFADKGVTREIARRAARIFVDKMSLLLSPEGLTFASAALAVRTGVGTGSIPAEDVSAIVKKATGKTVAEVLALPQFDAEEQQLADSLVAMWLLSDSCGGDAPGLAQLAQGYDAIRLVASDRNPISLRVLSIADFSQPRLKQESPPKNETSPTTTPSTEYRIGHKALLNLDAAIATLNTLPAEGFHIDESSCGEQRGQIERLDTRLAALEKPAGEPAKSLGTAAPPSVVTRPWMLSTSAISSLPQTVQQTLSEAGLDPHSQPLPVILNTLHAQRVEHLMGLERAKIPENIAISQVGNAFFQKTQEGQNL